MAQSSWAATKDANRSSDCGSGWNQLIHSGNPSAARSPAAAQHLTCGYGNQVTGNETAINAFNRFLAEQRRPPCSSFAGVGLPDRLLLRDLRLCPLLEHS